MIHLEISMEEIQIKPVLVIFPNGVVEDVQMEKPIIGRNVSINGKTYRVAETHDSMIETWDYVCQLSY